MRGWVAILIVIATSACSDVDETPPVGGPLAPTLWEGRLGPNEPATATKTATGCTERPPQTGAGCDQEGIQAAVQAEISADGGVGGCYRTHAADRGTGRLLMRIVLAPDGRASSVAVSEDGLDNSGLAACIGDLLRGLQYPAPGDVPCTALYPFNFQ